jgi:hypothetical protein
MENMIERVAESQAKFDGRELIAMPRGERERYRQRARLAIEAMREPTQSMIDAGYDQCDDPIASYATMINAALVE